MKRLDSRISALFPCIITSLQWQWNHKHHRRQNPEKTEENELAFEMLNLPDMSFKYSERGHGDIIYPDFIPNL